MAKQGRAKTRLFYLAKFLLINFLKLLVLMRYSILFLTRLKPNKFFIRIQKS